MGAALNGLRDRVESACLYMWVADGACRSGDAGFLAWLEVRVVPSVDQEGRNGCSADKVIKNGDATQCDEIFGVRRAM